MEVGEGSVKCFWLQSTRWVEAGVRRYVSSDERVCPGGGKGYCEAVRRDVLGRHRIKFNRSKYGKTLASYDHLMPKRSSRIWPRHCDSCGQPLGRGTTWQVIVAEVYTRSDTGAEVAFRGYGDKSLAGALYDSWWLHDRVVVDADGGERRYVGPDGIALVAICPNGAAWEVDGPSRSNDKFGPGWSRTGDPRQPETLNVAPSIIAGDYHGFLQAGHFTGHIG
jgi:hypothetical protein